MANNKVKIVVGFPANGGGGAVDSVNGQTGVVVLDKSNIGLSNVDNTSDADKPISDATQTALDDLQQEIPNPNNLVNQFTTNTQGVSGRFTVQEPLDTNTSDAASVGYVLDKLGGGGSITEDGTNLKYGTGSDFGTGGSQRMSAGINTEVDGDQGLAIGYNSKAGTKSVAIGNNVGFASKDVNSLSIGNDIRETENGSIVISGLTNQSTVGLRTKSRGSVMIGNNLDINGTLPNNGSVNGGTFIGNGLKNNDTNIGSAGIMIGNSINRGAAFQSLVIGDNIQMGALSGAGYANSVIFGKNLNLGTENTPDNVVIGYAAGAETDPNGDNVIGGQQVVIGKDAYAGSWRNTVIGAFAKADKVSSTVVGYGAYSSQVHGLVLGRGGYLIQEGGVEGSLIHSSHTRDKLIVGNAYAKFTNPYVEGRDEIVNNVNSQNNGSIIHKITTATGLDVDETPTVTDTKGAILDISGGVGTGTAESGLLRFSSAPSSLSSNNVLNALEIAAQIDAAKNVDTRFMLLDVTDGTIKRVEFGDDDSAGTGYKVLKVTN